MPKKELITTLRSIIGRAFTECLKRFKEEPLTEAQEWARLNRTLALEGDEQIEEDERLRQTHNKLYEVFHPYSRLIRTSRRLISKDIKNQGRN